MSTSLKIFGGCLLLALFVPAAIKAASSENYSISADSINFLGGTSSSETFAINSTGGEMATGTSTSENYIISAGYQAMTGGDVTMSISDTEIILRGLPAGVGGQSDGDTDIAVSSASGYTFSIKYGLDCFVSIDLPHETTQSMQCVALTGLNQDDNTSTVTINNYDGQPDYNWSVAETATAFGFSPQGTDVVGDFQTDGITCGSGANAALHCWDGVGATFREISSTDQPASSNVTKLNFRVEVGRLSPLLTQVGRVDTTIVGANISIVAHAL